MRIAYWTTASLEANIEAVSKEVFDLARHFEGSAVFGVSPHVLLRFGSAPIHVAVHRSLDPLLRLVVPTVERLVRVNHVYSEIGPWLYQKTLRRKPTVLTIASEKGDINPAYLDHVDAITVQTESMLDRLSRVERWRKKSSLVYPGVDLERFRPVQTTTPSSSASPKVLFATFPRAREEIEPRGVTLLLELARCNPDVQFDLLTRPWARGDTASSFVRSLVEHRRLGNVRLLEGQRQRMENLYREYAFTVIPYTVADGGKECPLSLVEGLACGIPVLISAAAPFAKFVSENACGVVFHPDPGSFRVAVEAGLSGYEGYRTAAVATATAMFDRRAVFRRFAALYDALDP